MDYKPMIAKSGEVFYTVSGNLHKCDSLQDYQELMEKNRKLTETFFEIEVGGVYHKLLVTRHDLIMQLIAQLDIDDMNAALRRYEKAKKEAGLWI